MHTTSERSEEAPGLGASFVHAGGVAADEHRIKRSMEQARAHLARADSELEAALRFLEPRTDDEAEMDLLRAVANARTSVGDALETIRARLGE
jgi:hypothetical protein